MLVVGFLEQMFLFEIVNVEFLLTHELDVLLHALCIHSTNISLEDLLFSGPVLSTLDIAVPRSQGESQITVNTDIQYVGW